MALKQQQFFKALKGSYLFQWIILTTAKLKLECVNVSAVYGNANKGFT